MALAMEQTTQQNPEQNCIFCQIASGKVQSKKVYEDSQVVSFLDINPATPGHLLLVPKKHHSLMMQLPPEETAHLFTVVQALSNSILKAFGADGTTVFIANGAAAGQRAPHMMVHIIPRYEKDELNFTVEEKQVETEALEKFRQTLLPLVNKAFGIQQEIKSSTPAKQTNEQAAAQPNKQPVKHAKQDSEKGEGKKDDVSLDDISKLFK